MLLFVTGGTKAGGPDKALAAQMGAPDKPVVGLSGLMIPSVMSGSSTAEIVTRVDGVPYPILLLELGGRVPPLTFCCAADSSCARAFGRVEESFVSLTPPLRTGLTSVAATPLSKRNQRKVFWGTHYR